MSQDKQISRKTAVLAKSKGYYDHSTNYEFYDKGHRCWFITNAKGGLTGKEETIQRPTQTKLQKWLRNKFNILVDIVDYYDESDLPLSNKTFPKPKGYFCWDKYDDNFSEENACKFNTYEKALEYGLQQALKLIK